MHSQVKGWNLVAKGKGEARQCLGGAYALTTNLPWLCKSFGVILPPQLIFWLSQWRMVVLILLKGKDFNYF